MRIFIDNSMAFLQTVRIPSDETRTMHGARAMFPKMDPLSHFHALVRCSRQVKVKDESEVMGEQSMDQGQAPGRVGWR